MSSSSISSPFSTLLVNLFSRLVTLRPTRKETSFWKTYNTANTKNAMVAIPGRFVASSTREIRDLLFLKAYSVSLDASESRSGRGNRRLTMGMKDALGVALGSMNVVKEKKGQAYIAPPTRKRLQR